MNGMNVLLHEDGKYRLYFGDFKARLQVHRASSDDGRHFKYEGVSLDAPMMVNDVRKFTIDGRPVYLMGLHANTSRLWYALSADGMKFEPQRELAVSRGDADKYIVAIGWVSSGDRILGLRLRRRCRAVPGPQSPLRPLAAEEARLHRQQGTTHYRRRCSRAGSPGLQNPLRPVQWKAASRSSPKTARHASASRST